MFLSRIILNPVDREVVRDLENGYRMHQRLLKAFPDGLKNVRDQIQLLYRLKESKMDTVPSLLVQSLLEPDWSKLPASFFHPGESISNPSVKQIDDVLERLSEGRKLHFKLKANATKKTNSSTIEERLNGRKRNGQRVPLYDEEEQRAWLHRKSIQHGFSILQVSIVEKVQVIGNKQGKRITAEGVTFEGQLRIQDRILFLQALQKGIGPSKAFGFGLLSLAP